MTIHIGHWCSPEIIFKHTGNWARSKHILIYGYSRYIVVYKVAGQTVHVTRDGNDRNKHINSHFIRSIEHWTHSTTSYRSFRCSRAWSTSTTTAARSTAATRWASTAHTTTRTGAISTTTTTTSRIRNIRTSLHLQLPEIIILHIWTNHTLNKEQMCATSWPPEATHI